jgi:2-oxoglutarate ferredoxin oxidoreductase subunit beta
MPTELKSKLNTLSAEDFASDQEVRWCPGCGDFAILAQVKQVLAGLDIPREKIAFVSGVGCSSRLPYYLNVYGFHTLHGRAPTVATGLKIARPDLSVWVVTGDGDGLGAGGGHLLHALRRNVDLKVLLFNNEVYGLSKGPSSPTTRAGTRTRTAPAGSAEPPLRPLVVALAAEASFVARTIDVDGEHLAMVLRRAAKHRGSAFVEIYQNCKIFNDGVFDYATDRAMKSDNVLYLEHGQPLVYGKDRNRRIRLNGACLESIEVNGSARRDDFLVHDEQAPNSNLAMLLAGMTAPQLPEVLGVLRGVERPTFEDQLADAGEFRPRLRSTGSVKELFTSEDTWEVA